MHIDTTEILGSSLLHSFSAARAQINILTPEIPSRYA
jgi:hypothetical protein